jgi:hypothetical protein
VQAQCFQHHWNTRPDERGRLFLVHNNPRNAIDGNRLKAIGLVAGVSDMIYLRDNRPPLCLEFKASTGSQQRVQKEWQAVAEATGCEYVLVRSMDEFCQALGIAQK